MESYYKHYARTNEKGEIILAYSDAFQEKVEGDICINERAPRQCPLQITDIDTSEYKYIVDTKGFREKTSKEINTPDVQKRERNKKIDRDIESLKTEISSYGYDLIMALLGYGVLTDETLPESIKIRMKRIDTLLTQKSK